MILRKHREKRDHREARFLLPGVANPWRGGEMRCKRPSYLGEEERSMDYSALWSTARKALKTGGSYSIDSSGVADLLGADRISRTELQESHGKGLADRIGYEFREVKGEYKWVLHFWNL